MWKEVLYFNRSQRRAIIVLLALIAITLLGNFAIQYLHSDAQNSIHIHTSAWLNFRKNLQQLPHTARHSQHWHNTEYTQHTPACVSNTKSTNYRLFVFDPNTLDSAGFVAMGLKPYIAKNILKYRKYGGHYRTPADFAKVYGLSAEKYKELAAYIQIQTPYTEKATTPTIISSCPSPIVNLNTADTSLLMQVKGIGRGYANAIVRFRQLAGGFVSVAQLQDINGMNTENYEKIKDYCRVTAGEVHPLRVNFSSVERMKPHPYLGFYKARDIYELRRRKGKLKDIEELREIPDITDRDIERLRPYLSFE